MKKSLKKIAISFLAAMMCVTSSLGMASVDAAETSDTNFTINISSSNPSPNTYVKRQKVDNSSSYVNYNTKADHSTSASGPYKFKCYIYGADNSISPLVDMSSYDQYGVARPEAIVTRGTTGYIYQRVNEFFGAGAYAQVYGAMLSGSYTGLAQGCWSPDSTGSGHVYNSN